MLKERQRLNCTRKVNGMPTKTRPSGAEVVADARRYLGVPYVFGGGPANPMAGLDCSGLVERVAFDLGINSCPRTSEQQWTWSEHVATPSTGDMVFFVGADGEPGNPGHVGFVVTLGTMIDAPKTGTVVQQQGYSNGTGPNAIVGYGRMRGVSPSSSANVSYITADKSNNAAAGGAAAGIFGFITIILFFGAIIALIVFGVFLLTRLSCRKHCIESWPGRHAARVSRAVAGTPTSMVQWVR